jgi:hypothetical protein
MSVSAYGTGVLSMSTKNDMSTEYQDFKALYDKAVKEGAEQFIFKGQAVLTAYAKYQIEFIEGRR